MHGLTAGMGFPASCAGSILTPVGTGPLRLKALAAAQPPPSSAPAQDRALGLAKAGLSGERAWEKQSEVCSESLHGALLPRYVLTDLGISVPHTARL